MTTDANTVPALTKDQIERILALAKKATPGPWTVARSRDVSGDVAIKAPGLLNVMAEVYSARMRHDEHSPETLPTAELIASLDPTTVIAALEELVALREALEPFAEAYIGVSMDDSAAAAMTVLGNSKAGDKTILVAADFRRARAALQPRSST